MASWRDHLTSTDSPYAVGVLKDSPVAAEFFSPVMLAKPTVSKGDMAVTCVLTTPRPDRQGDIVVPNGGDLSQHRDNPLVLFHHGKQTQLPIGKAEDKNGNYTVRLVKMDDGDRLVGTTYFSQSNRFANDVFGLVAEDILRGVSVGFDPKDDGAKNTKSVERLGPSPSLDRDALKFNSWTLLEYSHTPIGVNREALTVVVSKALDGSRAIHPKLLKYLTPYASPRKTVVAVGAQPPVSKAMPLHPDDDMDGDTFNQPTDQGDGGDVGVADEVPAEDGGAEAPPTPAVKTLLDGAQGLLDMCGELKANIGQSEHLKTRKYINVICDELQKTAEDMHTAAAKVQKELESGEEEMEPEEEGDGEEVGDDEGGDEGEEGEEMPPKKGKKKPPMETDDDGAIITKGYTPRRLVYADIAGGEVPSRAVKADPVPQQTKAKTTELPKGKIIVDQTDLDELMNEIELLKADREAAAKRRR